ncbi:hypothetical protein HMPREF0307_00187 [Corynebacterium sp. DNF00584]|nr:hypothetical protein HMPREF0307_00187 [Corynebacterium sp. DNF00584]
MSSPLMPAHCPHDRRRTARRAYSDLSGHTPAPSASTKWAGTLAC